MATGEQLSRAELAVMGLPSVALGLAPLLRPRRSAAAIGLSQDPHTLAVLRLVALRELVLALVFLQRGTPGWLWAFVVQDALDVPLCWWAWSSRRAPDRRRFRRACVAHLAVAAVDVYSVARRRGPARVSGHHRRHPARGRVRDRARFGR